MKEVYGRGGRKSGSGSATLKDVEVNDFLIPGDEMLLEIDFTFKYWYVPATFHDPEEGDEEITYDDVRDANTGKSIMPELEQKYGKKLQNVLAQNFDHLVVEYEEDNPEEFDSSRYDGPDDRGERI